MTFEYLLIIVALVINSTSAAILYLRGKPVSGWEPLENISLLAFPPFCYVSTLLENTGNNVDQYAHLFKASNFSKRTHNIGFSQRVTQVWCQQSILTVSSLKETSFRIISSQNVLLRTCVFLRHPYISRVSSLSGACANGSHTEQVQSTGWSQFFIV